VNRRDHLLELIARAFADVKPGKISAHEAEALDRYASEGERLAARARDPEEDWQAVPRATIIACAATFSFCDPDGWRFYLPAYMRHAVAEPGDVLDRVLSTLTLGWAAAELGQSEPGYVVDEATRDFRLQRFELLSPAQAATVREFLRYVAEDGDAVRSGEARTALGAYWDRPDQSQARAE
jgi:hypothetical protein